MNFVRQMRFPVLSLLLSCVLLVFTGCSEENTSPPETASPEKTSRSSAMQFRLVPNQQTGISFTNPIKETDNFNYFLYSYVYNGAGVATGDLDGDGLAEIFFTANLEKDALYQNEGKLKFSEISQQAGITHTGGFSNGVTMADVNQDGLLDIYICRSGPVKEESRRNLLYINKGKLQFEEAASQYGLDDPGYSTQAYFLDHDKDGDLDVYLVNHRVDWQSARGAKKRSSLPNDAPDSDHFYRNNGDGTFTNVTREAGVSNFAWGLSAAVGDYNDDGWDDIYVCNDFLEADFLYINQQNGTFKDEVATYMSHIPMNSMGSDFADINNDGKEDLYVMDMMPEDHVRSKMLMASMSTEDFWTLVDNGFHYQSCPTACTSTRATGNTARSASWREFPKRIGAGRPFSQILTTTATRIFLLPMELKKISLTMIIKSKRARKFSKKAVA